jgi:hypothetical protein
VFGFQAMLREFGQSMTRDKDSGIEVHVTKRSLIATISHAANAN